MTPERSLEEIIQEQAFASVLEGHAQSFFRLTNTLTSLGDRPWTKKHYDQLVSEAEALESFLDDFGARYNRTYSLGRELVASVRWFALAGFSLSHLENRFESYGVRGALSAQEARDALASLARARGFVRASLDALLARIRQEARLLRLAWPEDAYSEDDRGGGVPRQLLPRNVGEEDIDDEKQRIAEVASKFLASCTMLADLHIRRVQDPKAREQLLKRICTEAQARVYEATVHNLQSTYDTHVKNTVVEGRDARLSRLRGHISVALHLLEAVLVLTHFVERHEADVRSESADLQIARIIRREEAQDVILNDLLYWADAVMQRGRTLVDELLVAYINLQELEVELPEDLKLHARPAALIVGIVGRYGTPVELEVQGQKCNAGSILDLLITVGSNPDARHFVFRGDENPLRDISLLFQSGLGETGLDRLPGSLDYLRGK